MAVGVTCTFARLDTGVSVGGSVGGSVAVGVDVDIGRAVLLAGSSIRSAIGCAHAVRIITNAIMTGIDCFFILNFLKILILIHLAHPLLRRGAGVIQGLFEQLPEIISSMTASSRIMLYRLISETGVVFKNHLSSAARSIFAEHPASQSKQVWVENPYQ